MKKLLVIFGLVGALIACGDGNKLNLDYSDAKNFEASVKGVVDSLETPDKLSFQRGLSLTVGELAADKLSSGKVSVEEFKTIQSDPNKIFELLKDDIKKGLSNKSAKDIIDVGSDQDAFMKKMKEINEKVESIGKK